MRNTTTVYLKENVTYTEKQTKSHTPTHTLTHPRTNTYTHLQTLEQRKQNSLNNFKYLLTISNSLEIS